MSVGTVTTELPREYLTSPSDEVTARVVVDMRDDKPRIEIKGAMISPGHVMYTSIVLDEKQALELSDLLFDLGCQMWEERP